MAGRLSPAARESTGRSPARGPAHRASPAEMEVKHARASDWAPAREREVGLDREMGPDREMDPADREMGLAVATARDRVKVLAAAKGRGAAREAAMVRDRVRALASGQDRGQDQGMVRDRAMVREMAAARDRARVLPSGQDRGQDQGMVRDRAMVREMAAARDRARVLPPGQERGPDQEMDRDQAKVPDRAQVRGREAGRAPERAGGRGGVLVADRAMGQRVGWGKDQGRTISRLWPQCSARRSPIQRSPLSFSTFPAAMTLRQASSIRPMTMGGSSER